MLVFYTCVKSHTAFSRNICQRLASRRGHLWNRRNSEHSFNEYTCEGGWHKVFFFKQLVNFTPEYHTSYPSPSQHQRFLLNESNFTNVTQHISKGTSCRQTRFWVRGCKVKMSQNCNPKVNFEIIYFGIFNT